MPAADSQIPEALKLAQFDEKVPAEPEAGRNLFRFGVPPPPPPPPPVKYVPPQPPPDPGPPQPPPIPPVPLKYTVFMRDLDGRHRAFLVDPSGTVFQAVDGDVVDGKYKVHKVSPKSVEVSWVNGTGRRKIVLSGG